MKRVFLSFEDENAQKVEKLISLLHSPDYDLDFSERFLSAAQAKALDKKAQEKFGITTLILKEKDYRG